MELDMNLSSPNVLLYVIIILAVIYFYRPVMETFIPLKKPFVTLPPPKASTGPDYIPVQNFADKAREWEKNIQNANLYVNWFPMQKPPAEWEETMEGYKDVNRSQFIPHMTRKPSNAKRVSFPVMEEHQKS